MHSMPCADALQPLHASLPGVSFWWQLSIAAPDRSRSKALETRTYTESLLTIDLSDDGTHEENLLLAVFKAAFASFSHCRAP